MTALQISQNQEFLKVAMTEAFELLSKKTGISFESLTQQFPSNKKLQESVAKMVAEAAKIMESTLNA